jgi:hypothetical protein
MRDEPDIETKVCDEQVQKTKFARAQVLNHKCLCKINYRDVRFLVMTGCKKTSDQQGIAA